MSIVDAPPARSELPNRIPLSFNQEFLCMFDQGDEVGPFGPSYHIAGGWRVAGSIDVDTLRLALYDVTERHEALLTRVVRDADPPYQRILPASTPDLTVLDIPEDDPRLRDLRAQEFLNEVEAGSYRATDMPLLRAILGRFDSGDAVLALQAHHMAADAWSMQLLMRDVAVRYAVRRGYDLPALPDAAPYQDFARWQHEHPAGNSPDVDRAYWRERLQDKAILGLPTDWARSAKRAKASAWHRFTIPAAPTAAALRLARATRSTPFTVFLAAYTVFLGRRTGATDIVVPTFAPGRSQPRFLNSVGSFFNFVPLRVDLAGAATFRDVVDRTRRTCAEAFSHEIPFGQVVAEAPGVAAAMASDDLQVFVFQVERTLFEPGEVVGDLAYTEVRRWLSAPVGGDIPDGGLWTLSIDPAGATVASLAYNSNRFDAVTTGELVTDFRRVVRELMAGPDSVLS